MQLRQLSCIGKGRRLWWLIALLGVVFFMILLVLLARYPRQALLSDVQRSRKIVVDWHQLSANGKYHDVAFELNTSDRAQFIRDLTENLELDYFRSQAIIVPIIGIYLVGENDEFFAYYVIRRARGGSECPSMESLRHTASKGRPLSQIEIDKLYNDNLRSKWPHVLPCDFDYVLPVSD